MNTLDNTSDVNKNWKLQAKVRTKDLILPRSGPRTWPSRQRSGPRTWSCQGQDLLIDLQGQGQNQGLDVQGKLAGLLIGLQHRNYEIKVI